MIDTLLTPWESVVEQDNIALIIPDGCRDLIYKSQPGKKPNWFVSDLEGGSYKVPVSKGDIFHGYRLKPGTLISKVELLSSLTGIDVDQDNVLSRLDSFTTFNAPLDQALACLASDVQSVEQVSRLMGLSTRTLQRLVVSGTGKPPVFWLRLARVRKAGRGVTNANSLADLAFDYGFSDQAHMSREFHSWFDVSPSRLRLDPMLGNQMYELGYA